LTSRLHINAAVGSAAHVVPAWIVPKMRKQRVNALLSSGLV
jgi:hypothetical protein